MGFDLSFIAENLAGYYAKKINIKNYVDVMKLAQMNCRFRQV